MATSAPTSWKIWIIICLISSAIQILTLRFDPAFQQDEVQIVDMGRTALQPHTDWALTWNIADARPVLSTAHLGPVIQELAHRVAQPSHSGPRLMAMLGAVLAATCLLGWLLDRKTPQVAALILACAFLLDPAFTTSYREGRVDSWAFASSLLACWLIRSEVVNRTTGRRRPLKVLLAGACLVMAPFFWVTALMLAPLVLLEFTYLLRSGVAEAEECAKPGPLPTILVFATGGLIAAAVLMAPVLLEWESYFASLQTTLVGQRADALMSESLFYLAAAYDPMISMALILAVLFKREYGMLAALVMAMALMYQTRLYPSRAIYLLPYAYAMVAGAAGWAWEHGRSSIQKAVMKRILAVLLVWHAGMTLVVSPILAFARDTENDLRYQLAALEVAIGKGPYRVLLEDWASYYAARNLGWKVYRAPILSADTMYRDFLYSMDYVIVRETPIYDFTNRLVEADPGFELQSTIRLPAKKDFSISVGPVRIPVYQNNYPDLLVFRKIRESSEPTH